MKNYLLIFLVLLLAKPLAAQSVTIDSLSDSRPVNSLALRGSQIKMNVVLSAKEVNVKAGDSISISTWVHMEKPARKPMWKSFTKAIAPYLLFKNLTSKNETPLREQPTSSPSFGAGLTVIPGAVELVTNQGPTKMPSVILEAYDSLGNSVAKEQIFASKVAFDDWQEVVIRYKVLQSGFVNFSTLSGSSLSSALNEKIVHSTIIGKPKGFSDNSASQTPSAGRVGIVDPPTTNLLGEECTAYFLETFENDVLVDRMFLYMVCPINPPNGGGGGTVDPTDPCVHCKRVQSNIYSAAQAAYSTAQTAYNAGRSNAEVIFRASLAGCGVSALALWAATNTTGAWAHFFSGIGTIAVESLAAFLRTCWGIEKDW